MAKQDNPSSGNGSFTEKANSAFSQLGEQTSSTIDNSPLIALAGGIAIGALIAAVLPQTERETELLKPAGTKVTDAGRQAADRVREVSKAKVDELAGDKLRDFFGFSGNSTTA